MIYGDAKRYAERIPFMASLAHKLLLTQLLERYVLYIHTYTVFVTLRPGFSMMLAYSLTVTI